MLNKPLAIALTAVGILGIAACERDKVDEVGTDKDTKPIEGAKIGEPEGPREAGEPQISADMQRRMDAAMQRLDKLEREATEAKQRITAQGGEARTELEQDLERAKMQAKNKLEAARKASAQNMRSAIDDLEKALDDLDGKLKKYDQT